MAELGTDRIYANYRSELYSASQIGVRYLGRSIPIRELRSTTETVALVAVAPTRSNITLI